MDGGPFGEGGLNHLPVMDVGTVEEEPRRREWREPFAALPCYVDEKGWHRMQVYLRDASHPQRRATPADLCDCSPEGLCLTSRLPLRCGQRVEVALQDMTNPEEIFRQEYKVCSKRRVPRKTARCGKAAGKPAVEAVYTFGALVEYSMEEGLPDEPIEHQYGLHLEETDRSRLYKSYLDSIFLDYLREEADVDIDEVLTLLGGSERPAP